MNQGGRRSEWGGLMLSFCNQDLLFDVVCTLDPFELHRSCFFLTFLFDRITRRHTCLAPQKEAWMFWTFLNDFIWLYIYFFLCNIDRPFGPRFLTLTYSFVLCRASFRWWFCLRCKSYVRVLPWTYAYVIICMHVYKTSLLQAKCTTSI